jgi:3-methyladenine DNA glycosylase AlkD
VSDPGQFIDAALKYEGDWYRADAERERLGSSLEFYGASVGAVRGTVRDAQRKFPGLTHDDITALSSELWAKPVFERRLAAVVLLQSNVALLRHSDLTRIEGFIRSADVAELVDPLTTDVLRPLLKQVDDADRTRALTAVTRWAHEDNVWLQRAARLSTAAG